MGESKELKNRKKRGYWISEESIDILEEINYKSKQMDNEIDRSVVVDKAIKLYYNTVYKKEIHKSENNKLDKVTDKLDDFMQQLISNAENLQKEIKNIKSI